MNSELKQLFRDLNAAVQLNRPEGVDIALNGLLRLPGVAANNRMSDGFIDQVILPVGEKLSGLPSSLLRPLLSHSLVAGRAIGAAALTHRFLCNDDTIPDDLHRAGSDSRSDLRLSLGRTIISLKTKNPERFIDLGKCWIKSTSPKLRQTALIFLPAFVDFYPSEVIDLLGTLATEENHEVKGALVDALIQMGNKSVTTPVMRLLSEWSSYPDPNDWVICRTLSASWVVAFPDEVKAIMCQIYSKRGENKFVTTALKALRRNGLDINLKRDSVD